MILITTQYNGINGIFNYNNCTCVEIYDNAIVIIENTEVHYLAVIENKDLRKNVYNIIKNKIIDFNAKNENGHIDVEAIAQKVEDEIKKIEIENYKKELNEKIKDSKSLCDMLINNGYECYSKDEYVDVIINNHVCTIKIIRGMFNLKAAGRSLLFNTALEVLDALNKIVDIACEQSDVHKKLYEVLKSRGVGCTLYDEHIGVNIEGIACILKREYNRYYITGNSVNKHIRESFETVIELVDYLLENQKNIKK